MIIISISDAISISKSFFFFRRPFMVFFVSFSFSFYLSFFFFSRIVDRTLFDLSGRLLCHCHIHLMDFLLSINVTPTKMGLFVHEVLIPNNNNNNEIYIAPFTMCSRRLEESRKKMRFKFVFEPVHMIDNTDTARQLIPKMRPSHRKGTIARLFFGMRDLKCNGQIRTETVFSFVDTRLKI